MMAETPEDVAMAPWAFDIAATASSNATEVGVPLRP
jgi:hypothetical protein